MKRLNGRVAQLVVAGLPVLLAGQSARASDISCNEPVGGPAARCEEPYGSGVGCEPRRGARAGARRDHLICEYTMLSQRYDRIYAEQQRRLQKGTMHPADIAAWRARRDACDSVRCLDSIFHQFWRERDAVPQSPARPATAPPQRAVEHPAPARHEAASRPHPAPARAASRGTAPSARVPAPDANLASVASMPAVASVASGMPNVANITAAARPTAAPAFPDPPRASVASALGLVPEAKAAAAPAYMVMPRSRASFWPAQLLVESLVSGLAVLGAGYAWKRKRVVPRAGRSAQRVRIPAVMKIVYGLLLANALLLPFTFGLL